MKKENTGHYNTGHYNTGRYNTGHYNTGHYNTGRYNTGHYNTGHYNTGHYNTGHYNTGDHNTGHCNTGRYNTGHYNTGHYNTGHCNTGDHNTGHCNTGDYNTGYCNTTKPKVRLFNKESNIEFDSREESEIYTKILKYQKPLCEWISASNMTESEKESNAGWETTQGYLKINKIAYNGNDVTLEDEKFFRGLPNFDEEIFRECTGIDLSSETVKIIIDNKEITISKDEFEKIKAQFLG